MDNASLWGVILILYILPFWVWQVNDHYSHKARKEIYLNSPDQGAEDTRSDWISYAWCAGFLSLLFAHESRLSPWVVAIFAALYLVGIISLPYVHKRWRPFQHIHARVWLAGSASWIAGLVGWYCIFAQASFDVTRLMLLGIIPPIVAGVMFSAWRWAVRG